VTAACRLVHRVRPVLRSERGTTPEYVMPAGLLIIGVVWGVVAVLKRVSPETLDRFNALTPQLEPVPWGVFAAFSLCCLVLLGIVIVQDRLERRRAGPAGPGSSC